MSQENDSTCSSSKVFGIEELREEILMYAIYDNNGEISGKMVGNVRCVQKTWLQTTTKLLRKVKKPAIVLTLGGNGSIQDANDVNKKGKALDELVEAFGTPGELQDSFLPVKLTLTMEFFCEKNYQSLSDYLTCLRSDLVELQVEYPKFGGTMPPIFPSFSLPLLQKLSFAFVDEGLNEDRDDDRDGCRDNTNGLVFLQSILNASEDLKDMIIPVTLTVDQVPVDFKYLKLPEYISFLDLSIKLSSKELEVLLRNHLPNLSYLSLQIHEIPFEDDLLFKILERFQNTLRTLRITGLISDGNPEPLTHLQFPLMEKMETIVIGSTECELDPGNVQALQRCFPKLRVVRLLTQTEARLAKWTEDSRFESVEKLSVSIVNEEVGEDGEDYYISPDIEILTQLKQAFPNISQLSLTLNVSDLNSLKFVFENMVQLRSLWINIFGNDTVLDSSSDLIDSLFLGLPLRFVVALKEDNRLLDSGSILIQSGIEPSIRALSGLKSLTLDTTEVSDSENDDPDEHGMTLISNLLFRQTFMKMPQLRTLLLRGKFKASLEMEDEWSGEGRFMKYSEISLID